MKGHDDEISVLERHATDLEQSAEEIERVRIGEALGFRPWDALFGVFLGSGHPFRGEAEAQDIDVVTLPFSSCEHDGAQRFWVKKADIVEFVGKKSVRPSGAAPVGAHEKVFRVAGIFFSEKNLETACFDFAIPGHRIAELCGRNLLKRSFFGDVDVSEPDWFSPERERESDHQN